MPAQLKKRLAATVHYLVGYRKSASGNDMLCLSFHVEGTRWNINRSKNPSESSQIVQQPQLLSHHPAIFWPGIRRGYWLEFLECLAFQYDPRKRNSVENFIPTGWNFQINILIIRHFSLSVCLSYCLISTMQKTYCSHVSDLAKSLRCTFLQICRFSVFWRTK